jgi:hypothetical protein
MRKKGENSAKRVGQICYSARRNNDYTLGVESQTFHLADFAALVVSEECVDDPNQQLTRPCSGRVLMPSVAMTLVVRHAIRNTHLSATCPCLPFRTNAGTPLCELPRN